MPKRLINSVRYEIGFVLQVREPLPLIIHHLPIAVTFAFFGEESMMVIKLTHFSFSFDFLFH